MSGDVYTTGILIWSHPFIPLALTYIFFLLFHKRVELKDRERFPESRPAKEKPFRMYNDNTVIIVKLTSLEDGWKLDKTNDTQV